MNKYQLTRSSRKSLSICIERDGTVQVKAPNWLPKSQIDQFVQKKSAWIEQKRTEVRALEQRRISHTFQEGDRFAFLGQEYRLQIQQPLSQKEDSRMEIALRSVIRESPAQEGSAPGSLAPERAILRQDEKILSVTLPSADASEVKDQLEQWYLFQAKKIFPQRVAVYYPIVAKLASAAAPKGIGAVNRITIRSQKTRWGSCSSKGNLNFNWRLLMAPLEILDYVVVHELCHLAYLNHSPQFWQLVGDILPDYSQCRRWLRENGMLLQWEE